MLCSDIVGYLRSLPTYVTMPPHHQCPIGAESRVTMALKADMTIHEATTLEVEATQHFPETASHGEFYVTRVRIGDKDRQTTTVTIHSRAPMVITLPKGDIVTMNG